MCVRARVCVCVCVCVFTLRFLNLICLHTVKWFQLIQFDMV